MSYTAEVSRTNPSCFLFLIDQSGSMEDSFGGGDNARKKADEVSLAINRLLQNLILKCARAEGVRSYFDIGVIGYGANEVKTAFGGALAGKALVSISEVAENPLRIEERTKKEDDGMGGIMERTVKFPVWFEPVAKGGTPMCQALSRARSILEPWLIQHQDSFPPIVLNITDGESTDGDPTAQAESLRQLSSKDGNVLLLNLHISTHKSAAILFPDNEQQLPDAYAQLLFKISSMMPDNMRREASNEGFRVSGSSKGFGFNADMVSLIRFLDIGTRASNLR